MHTQNVLTSSLFPSQSSKKEKKSKKKDKTEKDDAADGAGEEAKEPKRAQRATSNVFALFNQAQIHEFKEVGVFTVFIYMCHRLVCVSHVNRVVISFI